MPVATVLIIVLHLPLAALVLFQGIFTLAFIAQPAERVNAFQMIVAWVLQAPVKATIVVQLDMVLGPSTEHNGSGA